MMKQYHEADSQTSFSRLRHELQALGGQVGAPLPILADGDFREDGLALDFDHWCLRILTKFPGQLTFRQKALLNALDAYLDAMSGEGNEDLWTEEAIRRSREWEDVRQLARQALEAFGWECEPVACDGALLA
jgi:hypothetical protein